MVTLPKDSALQVWGIEIKLSSECYKLWFFSWTILYRLLPCNKLPQNIMALAFLLLFWIVCGSLGWFYSQLVGCLGLNGPRWCHSYVLCFSSGLIQGPQLGWLIFAPLLSSSKVAWFLYLPAREQVTGHNCFSGLCLCHLPVSQSLATANGRAQLLCEDREIWFFRDHR